MSPSFLILCGLAEAALGTIALGTAAIAVEAVLAVAALEALAVTTGTTVAVTTGTTLAALLVRLGGVQRAGSGAQGLGEDLALVDPDLDADAAEGPGIRAACLLCTITSTTPAAWTGCATLRHPDCSAGE